MCELPLWVLLCGCCDSLLELLDGDVASFRGSKLVCEMSRGELLWDHGTVSSIWNLRVRKLLGRRRNRLRELSCWDLCTGFRGVWVYELRPGSVLNIGVDRLRDLLCWDLCADFRSVRVP